MFKKIIVSISLFLISIIWISFAVPSFENTNKLKKVWYNLSLHVSRNASLENNIRNLFFPSAKSWWLIWDNLKIIAVWLLFIFLVRAWSLLVMNADDEGELKKAKLNLLYILYGAFLIFASVWLLWSSILDIWWDATTWQKVLVNVQNKVIWNILIFFKSAAYFVAILMMVYYWIKIIKAQEKEDKIKAARTWALNIILALVAIKVLDYIYYIAQKSSFKSDALNFLTATGNVLWWILWVLLILAILYSAILLVTSRWNEEAWKKAKITIRNVFLVIVVVFLFIAIVIL